jgi:protein-S-isoprenylcysteine O-methyltransferase Ste14
MADRRLIKRIYRWRVRSGVFFLLAIIILARPTWASVGVGIAVCAVGLFVRAWASGHIKKEKELATTGPYQYTRNPLYLGNLVMGMSIAIGANSLWGTAVFAAYFLVFYPPVIREERERMKRLFPGQYQEYKTRVPLFFPTKKPAAQPDGTRFSWFLYKKNKELRALVGSAVVWAIIVAKLLIF